MRRPGSTDLLMISVTLIWGMNFAIVKGAYDYFHPLAFTALRFTLAVITLLFVLKVRGVSLRIDGSELPAITGLGVLSQTVYQILFVLGLANTKAGNAALLSSLAPVFAYVTGVLLKRERFSRKVLSGILISFAGVTAVILFGTRQIGTLAGGDVMILASAFCWGWYTGSAARLATKYGALRLTFWLMLTGTVILLPIVFPVVMAQNWSGIPVKGWLAFLYSALLAIVYSYVVWAYALERLGVSATAVYSNMTPLVALMAAWVILGEQPSFPQIAGAALILAGVIIVRSGPRTVLKIKMAADER